MYRKRGVSEVVVTRADVEVDVDMETTELGCYMWGSYVTDRSNTGIAETGYRAFVTWEPLTPEVEAENSLRFWRWLMEIRQECRDAGMTFAAYCYNAGAENTYLRRLAIAEEALAEEIEDFIASDEWIDLLREWDSQLITGGSSSLKTIAPLAGFQWEVDDAGGGESMIKHDLAARRRRGRAGLAARLQPWGRGGHARRPGVDGLDCGPRDRRGRSGRMTRWWTSTAKQRSRRQQSPVSP